MFTESDWPDIRKAVINLSGYGSCSLDDRRYILDDAQHRFNVGCDGDLVLSYAQSLIDYIQSIQARF